MSVSRRLRHFLNSVIQSKSASCFQNLNVCCVTWISDDFVCFLGLQLICFAFLRVCCNKSEAFIAGEQREGVDDGRAPLTGGFEEAAVTLYPVNSEYIVLERGC